MTTPAIYVTGCAKSGTTLVLRLLTAFGLEPYVEEARSEVNVRQFTRRVEEARQRGVGVVGKRTWPTVYSSALHSARVHRQLRLLAAHGVKVVNVVRDGRDVVSSDGNYVDPNRWIACMYQRRKYGDGIAAEVRYEDVVSRPDEVQAELGAALGLTAIAPFSTYPDFVPAELLAALPTTLPEPKKRRYGPRPLSTASVGRGLGSAVVPGERRRAFNRELLAAGYAPLESP